MAYSLIASPHYRRAERRFTRQHPELQDRLARILRDLETDPHQPHLQLHSLSGTLAGFDAVRLTHAYRIVLLLVVEDQRVTLIDIGSHDEVYR